MHNLHTEDNLCATTLQHKLLQKSGTINTQYNIQYKNIYSSKQNEKNNNDNDANHNGYETMATVCILLPLVDYDFPNCFVYMQLKRLHLFLFQITFTAIKSPGPSCSKVG